MSWICLNGTMSTTVQGLLIQTLPPISKPLMRTMIEEIDGRDGDIITKLGYSAYDKEITIGLHGDYDVDEVISFFNSEGEVIFSNEPDKFYRYQILDQIDFEHLLRFKTATVVFHVQPFKFSAVDESYLLTTEVLRIPEGRYQGQYTVVEIKEDNRLQINMDPSASDEFKIPIDKLTLDGSYILEARALVWNQPDNATLDFRIITENPVDSDSFGGQAYELSNSATSVQDTETIDDTEFNYLWFNVSSIYRGCAWDVHIWDTSISYFDVINRGNVFAKPKLTIYARGNITLAINNQTILSITFPTSYDYITIDAEAMNAYKGDVLKNRSVTGDYKRLQLPVGKSRISWTGDVRWIKVENGARWI